MRLDDYMKELNEVSLLSAEEEAALWRAFKERGDQQARRRLIESYQPLVFKQALPYRGFDGVMDLIQEGTVGLIEAVEHYDPRRGVAFSLFAVHRIRGRMCDFLKKEHESDVACMDASLDGEKGGMTFKEALADAAALSVPEQAESDELAGRLQTAMGRLPEKERAVLTGVYLESQPVEAVAEALSVSKSHIYRLQKSGIRRVRGMLSRFMQHWCACEHEENGSYHEII